MLSKGAAAHRVPPRSSPSSTSKTAWTTPAKPSRGRRPPPSSPGASSISTSTTPATRRSAELQSQVEQAKSHELAKKQIGEVEQDKERTLEQQIQYCTLVAPNEGYVVYAGGGNPVTGRPFIEPGSVVAERQKLFNLPNIRGPMRVNTKVKEAIVDRLAPGQTARIKVDAFPGQVFSGTVETVYPRPDAKIRAQAGRKVYETLVRIDNGPPRLRPGLTAQVEILTAERDHVLSVPIDAVLQFNGKDRVAVKDGPGRFVLREVTLGIANDTSIEVKQGLREGEFVIQNAVKLLDDDAKRAKPGPLTPPATKPAVPR